MPDNRRCDEGGLPVEDDEQSDASHRWDYCSACGPMVICGKCGNNCCSGGYGLIDGRECDACPSAYDKQEAEGEQHRNDKAPTD